MGPESSAPNCCRTGGGISFWLSEPRLRDLVAIGTRLNHKRRQLLVSYVLGKHIPISGSIAEDVGGALARAIAYSITPKRQLSFDSTLVIGFAETACGLGFLVALGLPGSCYAQTTRDLRDDPNIWFSFKESHSHAPEHHVLEGVMGLVERSDRVVIVDDELTTGATTWGLVCRLDVECPGRQYVIACLVDARSREKEYEFSVAAAGAGIDVTFVALVRHSEPVSAPRMDAHDHIPASRAVDVISDSAIRKNVQVLSNTANCLPDPRHGLLAEDIQRTIRMLDTQIAQVAAPHLNGTALVLGVEEGMHSAILVAAKLGAQVQSTSRSPAAIMHRRDYPIQTGVVFTSAYDSNQAAYLYNGPRPAIADRMFEDVLLIDPRPSVSSHVTGEDLLAAASLCGSGNVWHTSPQFERVRP